MMPAKSKENAKIRREERGEKREARSEKGTARPN
jgi:hypothetical protein